MMTTDVVPFSASVPCAFDNTCICFRMDFPILSHFIHSFWSKACSNNISNSFGHGDLAEVALNQLIAVLREPRSQAWQAGPGLCMLRTNGWINSVF